MSAARRLASLLLWALVAIVMSCDKPATQIVVVVASDMQPTAELRFVRVSIQREGSATRLLDRIYQIQPAAGWAPGADAALDGFTLPGEIAVTAYDSADPRRLQVSVSAFLREDEGNFTQLATVRFEPDHLVYLSMFLAGRCRIAINQQCAAGTTCGLAGCIPIERSTTASPPLSTLQDAATPDLGSTDAGTNADAGTDAGTVVGIDAGTDAGTDAGIDAAVDAGTDAGIDAGTDAGIDVAADAGIDAGSDAGADVVRDVRVGVDVSCGRAGALEVCGDGVDNNCNGRVDEGCRARSCGDGGLWLDAAWPAYVTDPQSYDSHCGEQFIDAGAAFTMGERVDAGGPAAVENEVANVRVSPFRIDRYEVSVARFRGYYAAAMPVPPLGVVVLPGGVLAATEIVPSMTAWVAREPSASSPPNPYCHWSREPAAFEEHPLNCVDWFTAMAFCVWDGGRLPTEAEWEFVARYAPYPDAPVALASAVAPGRRYPWGDDETSCDANVQNPRCASPAGRAEATAYGTWAIGYDKPRIAWQRVFDLSGNAFEWTADAYSDSGSGCWDARTNTFNLLCARPPSAPATFVGRGGGFNSVLWEARGAARQAVPYSNRDRVRGFRCVRSP